MWGAHGDEIWLTKTLIFRWIEKSIHLGPYDDCNLHWQRYIKWSNIWWRNVINVCSFFLLIQEAVDAKVSTAGESQEDDEDDDEEEEDEDEEEEMEEVGIDCPSLMITAAWFPSWVICDRVI